MYKDIIIIKRLVEIIQLFLQLKKYWSFAKKKQWPFFDKNRSNLND